MAKRQKMVEKQKPTSSSGDGFTTFSIRLNDQQRDLLIQAAILKGWTPTQLVRTAALERAIAICNTGSPRTFDYKGLASELAGRWFAPREVTYQITEQEWFEMRQEHEGGTLSVPVPPLPIDVAFKLKKAAIEGGSEFLNLLVEFAEGLTASQRTDLPAPIDPKRFVGREE